MKKRPCAFCGKGLLRRQKRFCNKDCYTASGERVKNGKINGRMAIQNYWKKFFFEWDEVYGKLSVHEQVKLAFKLGQRSGYRARSYRKGQLSLRPTEERIV